MRRDRRDLSFGAPEMKCVCENYVAHEVVIRTIADVQRGIELEIRCNIASKANRRRIFRTALPIHLHPPSFVKVVSVTEDCLVLVAGVNGPDGYFVMFSPITSLDKRLWIFMEVWRPIHEANGKKIRLFP